MLNLLPTIERIKSLLAEDTEPSVTYAALEARLALEKVCYDRLRQRHDYISHDQLKKWQPRAVVNTLITEVDPYVTETRTLSMGRQAARGVSAEAEDFVQLGTEIGFNAKRIEKMWNALAKLALHVRLPEHREDHISNYGDKKQIRAKVDEVIEELERLAKSTMAFSGIGEEISFACTCGEKNRRRASLLKDGQHVLCINPDCKITWKAVSDGDSFGFESVTVPVRCQECRKANYIPWRYFIEMKPDNVGSFSCHVCQHKNFVQWRLMQVRPSTKRARKIKDSLTQK